MGHNHIITTQRTSGRGYDDDAHMIIPRVRTEYRDKGESIERDTRALPPNVMQEPFCFLKSCRGSCISSTTFLCAPLFGIVNSSSSMVLWLPAFPGRWLEIPAHHDTIAFKLCPRDNKPELKRNRPSSKNSKPPGLYKAPANLPGHL